MILLGPEIDPLLDPLALRSREDDPIRLTPQEHSDLPGSHVRQLAILRGGIGLGEGDRFAVGWFRAVGFHPLIVDFAEPTAAAVVSRLQTR